MLQTDLKRENFKLENTKTGPTGVSGEAGHERSRQIKNQDGGKHGGEERRRRRGEAEGEENEEAEEDTTRGRNKRATNRATANCQVTTPENQLSELGATDEPRTNVGKQQKTSKKKEKDSK